MALWFRSSFVLRQGLKRTMNRPLQTRRSMGGHGGRVPYAISEGHTAAAEYFSIFAWLWFLHRCRVDGPIHLGMRHPWEHDDDDAHHSSPAENQSSWDAFTDKAVKMNDNDDDDDEEDDDE